MNQKLRIVQVLEGKQHNINGVKDAAPVVGLQDNTINIISKSRIITIPFEKHGNKGTTILKRKDYNKILQAAGYNHKTIEAIISVTDKGIIEINTIKGDINNPPRFYDLGNPDVAKLAYETIEFEAENSSKYSADSTKTVDGQEVSRAVNAKVTGNLVSGERYKWSFYYLFNSKKYIGKDLELYYTDRDVYNKYNGITL